MTGVSIYLHFCVNNECFTKYIHVYVYESYFTTRYLSEVLIVKIRNMKMKKQYFAYNKEMDEYNIHFRLDCKMS